MKVLITLIVILSFCNIVFASPPLQQKRITAPVTNPTVDKSNQKAIIPKDKTIKLRKPKGLWKRLKAKFKALKKKRNTREKNRWFKTVATMILIVVLGARGLVYLLVLLYALAYLGLPPAIAIMIVLSAAVVFISLLIKLLKKVYSKYEPRNKNSL